MGKLPFLVFFTPAPNTGKTGKGKVERRAVLDLARETELASARGRLLRGLVFGVWSVGVLELLGCHALKAVESPVLDGLTGH